MKVNWLWDSRLTQEEAEQILKDKNNPKFDSCAEMLLSRVNDPKEVFALLDKKVFCQKWPVLKKRIKRDKWLQTRVVFWQTIYEHLCEEFKKQGIKIREKITSQIPTERKKIADQIKLIRKKLGYSQKELAQRMGVIQQYVSRIETGRENFSIDTLKQVAKSLHKTLVVKLT